ncbi:MAG: ring-cleaving dioxygenase, partial [Chloroflexota bacterium]
AGVLGLRLVKQTVNFDDPNTYHLYFGDELGHPGTILTFFPWPSARHGSRGTGQVSAIALAISANSLDYWQQRLTSYGFIVSEPASRFGEQIISVYDPSGLLIELATQTETSEQFVWKDGFIPTDHAISGIAGVTLTVAQHEPTAALLTDTMGFRQVDEVGKYIRYAVADGGSGKRVDVVSRPDVPQGFVSVGTVHHIAWRTPNDEEQQAWRELLLQQGYEVTPIRDRQYFRSIYFREPGGVLFEIATDEPGFAVNEQPDELGTHLMLPPWLEEQRIQLEQTLPPITLPVAEDWT